jgi:pSer/pThr/pTyr-binding forkhead associated (FHA) protein
MNPGEASIAEMRATLNQEFDVVLVPVSDPALGVIRISESLFAIGRSEAPFADYPRERVARLSRRHARIFSEHGAVYVADLDSKNGTSVNGVSVRESPSRVRAGDELCFGGELAYRVGIEPRAFDAAAALAAQQVSVTLMPERPDLGLEPIDVEAFPFLISKTDPLFARYKERFPHQVNYISRRHAHLFLRGGEPYVEDLGSTNGTFVGGKRLDESALALHDGDVLGFGSDHFVYRVKVHKAPAIEPTVTHLMARDVGHDAQPQRAVPDAPSSAARPASVKASAPAIEPAIDMDKTTFVGAAHSFLDIFYVDRAVQREDEVNEAARPAAADHAADESRSRRPRNLFSALAAEYARTFAGGDRKTLRRIGIASLAVVLLIAAVATALYMRGASERELKRLLAIGDDEQALVVANAYLARHPTDDAVRTLASVALMKARVPGWLDALRAEQFDRAAALIGGMKASSAGNPDTTPLIDELQWVGEIERFAARRGTVAAPAGGQAGSDAPIQIYGDEARINRLLEHWDDDPKSHQRTLDRIAAYVPQFADPYALALSHLRKLQSDDSVYVAAIDRLNTAIGTELVRDKPDALTAVFDDYAQRYPRLAGLDSLRADLRQYIDLLNALLARRLTPLLTQMKQVRFTTPPFQGQYRQLAASRLPSPNVVRQHDDAIAAWQRGDTQQALDVLQQIAGGAWSQEIAAEYQHKKTLAAQFAELQTHRGGKDYQQRLLSFYAGLDPAEDVWFVRAVAPQVASLRDSALAQAHAQLERAQALWRQYRANGSIGGTQRLESGLSDKFRGQARLLTDAQAAAHQGMRVYTQLKADHPSQWDQLVEDVDAESALQRRSLEELRMVLEPGLLKAKLALIGGEDGEARSSP